MHYINRRCTYLLTKSCNLGQVVHTRCLCEYWQLHHTWAVCL